MRHSTRKIVLHVERNEREELEGQIDVVKRDLKVRYPSERPGSEYQRVRREAAILGGSLVILTVRRALTAHAEVWGPSLEVLVSRRSEDSYRSVLKALDVSLVPRSFGLASPVSRSKQAMVPDAETDPQFDMYLRAGLAVLLDAYDGEPFDWHPSRTPVVSLASSVPESLEILRIAEREANFRYGELATKMWRDVSKGADPFRCEVDSKWSGTETARILATLHIDAKESADYSRSYLISRFVGQLRDAYLALEQNTSGDTAARFRALLVDSSNVAARSRFDRYALSASDEASRAAGLRKARITSQTQLKQGGCPGSSVIPGEFHTPQFATAAEQLALLSALLCVPTAWHSGRSLEAMGNRLVLTSADPRSRVTSTPSDLGEMS